MSQKLLLVLLGPTGTGKSELGVGIAQALGGEIVNCDSIQLYCQLEIGTGQPTNEQRRLVPHHLYGVIDPDEYYSAGRYMSEARQVCREIAQRGGLPIVVGGTGLYLRALLEGIFEGPGRQEELRQRLQRIGSRKGFAYLHTLLKKKDPETAQRIQPADRLRIVRALEVYFSTGTPISHFQRSQPGSRFRQQPLDGFCILKFGLNLPRQILYDRIQRRVDEMFRSGLVEEVKQLLDKGYSPASKGFEALGYRHTISFLSGELGLEEMIELTGRDTRNYAKRQLTWFRKEKDVHWIDFPGETTQALEEALKTVKQTRTS